MSDFQTSKLNVLFLHFTLYYRTFCWSGQTFDIRVTFLVTTNDIYVATRTFNLSLVSPTRNLDASTPQQDHLFYSKS